MSKYFDSYAAWAISKAVTLLGRASERLDGQARYTVDAARANLQQVLDEEFGDSGGQP